MVKCYAADISWRIRYTVADNMVELIKQSGPSASQRTIVPLFAAFLRDKESEVRACALRHLAEFSKLVSVPLLVNEVLPALQEL